jgi:hypothetical protein
VPSSALTDVPSGPVIDFGSAWNARYMSDGASMTSRGPGIARTLEQRRRQRTRTAGPVTVPA